MKKPFFNQEQRQDIINNTDNGLLLRFKFSVLIVRRDLWKDYWLLGELIFRMRMRKILKPLNEQIKINWE